MWYFFFLWCILLWFLFLVSFFSRLRASFFVNPLHFFSFTATCFSYSELLAPPTMHLTFVLSLHFTLPFFLLVLYSSLVPILRSSLLLPFCHVLKFPGAWLPRSLRNNEEGIMEGKEAWGRSANPLMVEERRRTRHWLASVDIFIPRSLDFYAHFSYLFLSSAWNPSVLRSLLCVVAVAMETAGD